MAQSYEFHRLITSAFFHVNLLHIGMNMMSFFYLGQHLERLFGSTLYFFNIVVFILFGGILHVALGYALALILRDAQWVFTRSVGFSGVLFSLAVQVLTDALTAHSNPLPTISCHGRKAPCPRSLIETCTAFFESPQKFSLLFS